METGTQGGGRRTDPGNIRLAGEAAPVPADPANRRPNHRQQQKAPVSGRRRAAEARAVHRCLDQGRDRACLLDRFGTTARTNALNPQDLGPTCPGDTAKGARPSRLPPSGCAPAPRGGPGHQTPPRKGPSPTRRGAAPRQPRGSRKADSDWATAT